MKNYCQIWSVVVLSCLFLVSCGNEFKKTPRESLLNRLNSFKGKGILFGHQDDLAYGMGWRYVEGESDVKRVSGSYPAIFGWDIGGIEKGDDTNLDGVPFDKMRGFIQEAHRKGGINTISWHAFKASDLSDSWTKDSTLVKRILPGGDLNQEFNKHLNTVADFLESLRDEQGTLIPIMFRPWHEMNGNWFWWGNEQCTVEEYKTLFRYTIDYLRNVKKLNNIVSVYSPDNKFSSQKTYLNYYPGNDVVDIMGLDNYGDLGNEALVPKAIEKLHIVIDAAIANNKLSAFTETGQENVTNPNWFTSIYETILNDEKIKKYLSYSMVWRSDDRVHFFFSYPGHTSEKATQQFLASEHIWLLNTIHEFEK